MRNILILIAVISFAAAVNAQVDEICSESGFTPSLDSPFAHVPYVFGKVAFKGFEPGAKLPRVTVTLTDGQRPANRQIIGKSGNFCFRGAGGGTLVVDSDGTELTRRALPTMGSSQDREDFEIFPPISHSLPPSKFTRPTNDKTAELYQKAAEAEAGHELEEAIRKLKEIVAIDPPDFIAWAKLGSLQFVVNSLSEADASFRKSLELRVDYTPAWINVGQLRTAQKQYPAAIEILKHAIELDAGSARAFQLLGEAYLLNKQGTLAVQALDEALKLDPTGMAECHLQKAHLYELAGAKKLAANEYKIFLTKVPDHPDRKKFEKFIKDNSE